MRAAVFEKYGSADVIHLTERPDPSPGPDEILVRVVSTAVNSADWRLRSLSVPPGFGIMVRAFMGWSRPNKPVLGVELAGRVEAIGDRVTRFGPGDEVVAFTGTRLGAHATHVVLPAETAIVPKPKALSWDEAGAMCFGGTAAIDFLLNKARLERGESVLINGAAGSVGTAAIQIARYAGADITAVCGADQATLVRELGADTVLDYRHQDPTKAGRQWDVILDAAGTMPWSRSAGCLADNGRLLMVVASFPETLGAIIPWRPRGRRLIAGTAREHIDDVTLLARLADEGRYRPVIDSIFPFERIADAHRQLDAGSKHGSLAIRVSPP